MGRITHGEESRRDALRQVLPRWVPSHADKIIRRLERDVFPWIGSELVGAVTAPKLLTTMRRIGHRGAIETAHRASQLRTGVPLRRCYRPG